MLAIIDVNGLNQVVVKYMDNNIKIVECTEQDQEMAIIKARQLQRDINNRKNWKAIRLV